MLPSVIEECEKAGIVTLDKGAKCIFVENDKVPLIIVKGIDFDDKTIESFILIYSKHKIK